jgi:hypothetical protein
VARVDNVATFGRIILRIATRRSRFESPTFEGTGECRLFSHRRELWIDGKRRHLQLKTRRVARGNKRLAGTICLPLAQSMRQKFPLLILLSTLAILATGCAIQSVEVSRPTSAPIKPIRKIALMPGGGVLAEAVGVQLMASGFDIFDMTSRTAASGRINDAEIEVTSPSNLKSLAAEYGVDGVLIVKTISGYDDKPNSAVARVLDTRTGSVLAGVTWQNGKGGAAGSPADNLMRTDVSSAAKKIAEGIASALR